MPSAEDTGYAPPKWQFDPEVTRVFDNMLARSIPDYVGMRDLVKRVGNQYVRKHTSVVDLGCSRGGALREVVNIHGDHCKFVGVEVSAPMLEECRREFALEIGRGSVSIVDLDLRVDFPAVSPRPSLVLAVLTLQFIPIEHRQRLVRRVYEALDPGGAFVVVEKTLGEDSGADDVLVRLYHGHKMGSGYSKEEVDRKAMSLEGVLVPLTESANVRMLASEGFRVQPFWRHLNFAAWVAVKP